MLFKQHQQYRLPIQYTYKAYVSCFVMKNIWINQKWFQGSSFSSFFSISLLLVRWNTMCFLRIPLWYFHIGPMRLGCKCQTWYIRKMHLAAQCCVIIQSKLLISHRFDTACYVIVDFSIVKSYCQSWMSIGNSTWQMLSCMANSRGSAKRYEKEERDLPDTAS